jgi:cell wall-associated NlpC family hydrolase
MGWASKYIRIPFQDRGRGFNGCDCYGLLRLVYRYELGIDLLDLSDQYSSYKDQHCVKSLVAFEKMKWEEISKGKQKPFDAVLIRLDCAEFNHVGIVINEKLLLNTKEEIGVHIIEYQKSTPYWHPNLIGGFYRWKKV